MTGQQLHIVDTNASNQEQTSAGTESATEIETPEPAPSPYDEAEDIEEGLSDVLGQPGSRQRRRQRTRFVRAVADEVGKDELVRDVRVLDQLDADETEDVDLGTLLTFPDDSIMFVGIDPTARDSVPLFAFTVERHQPIPAPLSAADALDLLRPGAVQDAFEDETEPDRQGEWWLLPTRKVPVGSTFTPGVNSRPFGPSPLGNHVPREYGFAVSDDEFMGGVREIVDELPTSITTPPETIRWLHRQRRKVPTPEYVPEWDAIRQVAGEIYVRGTLRHRENDHYVEDVGNQWHEAITHNLDVYTGDEMVDRVVLD